MDLGEEIKRGVVVPNFEPVPEKVEEPKRVQEPEKVPVEDE